jgi:hypothetical protein
VTSPAYLEAIADRALVGFPLSLYAYLWHHVLDPVQFRPVKQLAIASQFQVDERTVRRAITTLIERHYLEKGPVDVSEARTYRLIHSRAPVAGA